LTKNDVEISKFAIEKQYLSSASVVGFPERKPGRPLVSGVFEVITAQEIRRKNVTRARHHDMQNIVRNIMRVGIYGRG
jgi:hypothetical protein